MPTDDGWLDLVVPTDKHPDARETEMFVLYGSSEGFTEQRATRLEGMCRDLLQEILSILLEQLDVSWNAPCHSIQRDEVVKRRVENIQVVDELQRLQAYLPGAPAVQRAPRVKTQAAHHAHQATA